MGENLSTAENRLLSTLRLGKTGDFFTQQWQNIFRGAFLHCTASCYYSVLICNQNMECREK